MPSLNRRATFRLYHWRARVSGGMLDFTMDGEVQKHLGRCGTRDQQRGGTGVTASGGDVEDHRLQPQRTRSQSHGDPDVGATHGPSTEPSSI